MRKDYTHITFILDRSGSMEAGNMWSDAINGLKSIIEEQKKDNSLCTFSFCFFDTVIESPLKFANIQEISAKTIDDFKVFPRGGTSLLDALGISIKETGAALDKMAESERPAKVIFMVQTDGQENSSNEYDSDSIKAMIKEHEEKYSWKFMFLSSDLQAVNQAVHFGFAAQSVTVFNGENTTGAYSLLNAKVSGARCATTNEAYISSTTFSEEDTRSLN